MKDKESQLKKDNKILVSITFNQLLDAAIAREDEKVVYFLNHDRFEFLSADTLENMYRRMQTKAVIDKNSRVIEFLDFYHKFDDEFPVWACGGVGSPVKAQSLSRKAQPLSSNEITTLLGEKIYRIEEIYLEEKSLNHEKVELMKEITALKDQIRGIRYNY